MRRYLLIFMLVLMPLQFSWAAVAGYCQHETGKQAQHLGHHPHEHSAKHQHGDAPDKKAKSGFDNDCSTCQFGASALIVGAAPASHGNARTMHCPEPADHAAFFLTYPIERPKWSGLA